MARSHFSIALADRQSDPAGRRWLYVPYDQLSDRIGPLAAEEAGELGIVVIENTWKAARRPYHRQKLALVLANLRHFALEQAGRGVAVRHVVARGPYRAAIEPLARELGPIRVMRPAERELRVDLASLVAAGALVELPHEGWLTTRQDLDTSRRGGGPPWRMDSFYRQVRRRTGILMDGGKPLGGKLSHDADNRRPWPGDPPAPELPRFRPDDVTVEVGELVERSFTRHPGALDLESLPATRQDAERLWSWARSECLHDFGPFEDAMSAASSGLFHTRISALLNLHRLLPAEVVRDVAGMDLPLASKEGFIRQVLGWREFVHHVHEATDGFRSLPGAVLGTADRPGDGGWSRWSGASWDRLDGEDGSDGGAMPDHLDASRPLPVAYWGRPSGLACLDLVVHGVWRDGWSHHITRLMVLANIATLVGVSPRELADWFWVATTDAYDWVVEPNVLGKGSFAAGPVMTTKPSLCGAAYIDRMSDFCAGCAFDPKRDCPISNLYWAFLDRQRGRLEANPRMRVVMNALGARSPARLDTDRSVHRWVAETLGRGEVLRPEDRPGGRRG